MKRLIPVLFILLIGFNKTKAQTKNTLIKLSDFETNSPYYNQDILTKKDIYKYLSKQITKNKKIREKLLSYCSENKDFNSSEKKEKGLKSKNDSIISALNSLGGFVYCIKNINENGDIFYVWTRAANLNIISDEGVLRRN